MYQIPVISPSSVNPTPRATIDNGRSLSALMQIHMNHKELGLLRLVDFPTKEGVERELSISFADLYAVKRLERICNPST